MVSVTPRFLTTLDSKMYPEYGFYETGMDLKFSFLFVIIVVVPRLRIIPPVMTKHLSSLGFDILTFQSLFEVT